MLSQPAKKPLHLRISPQDERYDCQGQLGTIGMRIRQSVDQGYKLPAAAACGGRSGNGNGSGSGSLHTAGPRCVQDNSSVTIPEYKRVPLTRDAPLLVNQRTVSSTSSLEAWEETLEQRLTTIDDQTLNEKLGVKRNWDQAEF